MAELEKLRQELESLRARVRSAPIYRPSLIAGTDTKLIEKAQRTAYNWRQEGRGFDAKLLEDLVALVAQPQSRGQQ